MTRKMAIMSDASSGLARNLGRGRHGKKCPKITASVEDVCLDMLLYVRKCGA